MQKSTKSYNIHLTGKQVKARQQAMQFARMYSDSKLERRTMYQTILKDYMKEGEKE